MQSSSLQSLGKPDDVRWIELGNRDHERHPRFHHARQIRSSQLRSSVRLRPSAPAVALSTAGSARTTRPASSWRSDGLPVRPSTRAKSASSRWDRRWSGRQNVERGRRHEYHSFDADSLGAIILGMSDISACRDVSGGLRPYENALGVSLVFGSVLIHPENDHSNVLGGIVPRLRPARRCMFTPSMPFFAAHSMMLS